MNTETRDLARGRWTELLLRLGIDASFLMDRHGPCPICGGKDRFRFDDKNGRGTFICNQCGAGDGFDLLMKYFRWTFKDSAQAVRRVLGAELPSLTRKISSAKRNMEATDRKGLEYLWRSARPIESGDPVDKYLRSRKLSWNVWPLDLRFCEKCRLSRGDGQAEQMLPAMLALVRDPEGRPVNIQKTFLGSQGKARFATTRRLMPGCIPSGASIRLSPPTPVIGIAEGVETALAAASLFGLPVWSALNAACLQKWVPPLSVRKVVVFADNDANGTGQGAATRLLTRLIEAGIDATMLLPEAVGTDWADELVRRQGS
ncbi:toprim domain-containing protein [Defluviimonas aestuarii]|uniref:DUF7146 domain-containing protein n=1 Tax=Albidovulum aestuarii TaxID=1130726 RepID=UPI00249A5247|nr:toprim domain-containing protein [Defluviimonas aestuarii]MDI3336860.1 toprim domain-containing protein [Defluviimonas aestuarii]